MSLRQIAPCHVIEMSIGEQAGRRDSRLIRNGLQKRANGDSRRRVVHRHHHVTHSAEASDVVHRCRYNFNKFIWRVPIYIRLTWVHKRACCGEARSGLSAAVAYYGVSGFE